MFGGFILGVIVGSAAVWLYGREIREYVDDTTRGVRSKAADTLHAAAQGLQGAKERVESAAEATRSTTAGDVARAAIETAAPMTESARSPIGDVQRRIS